MFQFFHSVNKRFRMLMMALLSVFVFTVIYSFCDDEEFTSWITSFYESPTVRVMYLTDVFDKLGHKIDSNVLVGQDKMISRKDFVDHLPIYKDHLGEVYILKEHNEKTLGEDSRRLRGDIFDISDNVGDDVRGYIPKAVFVKMPLNTKYVGNYRSPQRGDLNYSEIAKNNQYAFGFWDRLYFSFITQSTIGFGDVVPASRRVRMIAMCQALCTLLIVGLH